MDALVGKRDRPGVALVETGCSVVPEKRHLLPCLSVSLRIMGRRQRIGLQFFSRRIYDNQVSPCRRSGLNQQIPFVDVSRDHADGKRWGCETPKLRVFMDRPNKLLRRS